MSLIAYDDIYASFLGNITDIKLANMDELDATAYAKLLLRDACAEPKVSRLFSELVYDDDNETLGYKLNSGDDDDRFVVLVLGLCMVCQWIEPQVQNTLDLHQLFTGSDQKFFSQSSHMAEKMNMRSDAEVKLDRILKDYKATHNSYLNN